MKILHDWDNPYTGRGTTAFRRGLQLILFALSKKIPLLTRIPMVRRVRDEHRSYVDVLAMLDDLAGVKPIFGVRDRVEKAYPGVKNYLRETYGVDVRRHLHIGRNRDPDRTRTWEPLDGLEHVTSNVWHFDKRYSEGAPPKLGPGELPIWHVDHPSFLRHYIRYLYERKHCEDHSGNRGEK